MKDSTTQFNKMTQWPVSKLVITLGIPTTISMLVTNIYNMADTYFVGQIGNSASGAVGVVFGLMAIIQAFGFMYGHGAGSIISRRLGEKDTKSTGIYASTAFFWALLTGLIITVFGFLFLDPLMYLLGSTDTILPYARTYASFILISAPFMAASFVLNNILRYEGKASLAMIGLVTGSLINIIADPILMFGLDMGIAGAGLSTALSQLISFSILLSIYIRKKTEIRISFRLIAKKSNVILNIVKTGFPSLIRQGLNSISTMVLNQQARLFGDVAVAAMSVVNRICFFIFAVGLGIGQGFQPVSAFNYGARKYSRVRKAFYFTFFMGEVLLGSLAIVGFFFSSSLVGIFRDDVDVIRIGTVALRVQLISLFFQPFTVCANMMFQSIGKNGVSSILSMLRSGLFFIPTILILTHCFGLIGVEASQSISDILSFLVTIPFVINFFRKLPKDDNK